MKMEIIKVPEYENDDYLFRIRIERIPTGDRAIEFLQTIDQKLANYYVEKRRAFALQDTNPEIFSQFVDDRPSLRALSQLNLLDSTIYTVACERENQVKYLDVISNVKSHLKAKPSTRRCAVRFINAFSRYFSSEVDAPSDVTCLSFIHYMSTGARLVFRASDVKNELLVDILTIKEFFLDPVYEPDAKDVELSVYSSTAQQVSNWDDFVNVLRSMR